MGITAGQGRRVGARSPAPAWRIATLVLALVCIAAGGSCGGNGRTGTGSLWIAGYPWAEMTVTDCIPAGMTRADILQNILVWLED